MLKRTSAPCLQTGITVAVSICCTYSTIRPLKDLGCVSASKSSTPSPEDFPLTSWNVIYVSENFTSPSPEPPHCHQLTSCSLNYSCKYPDPTISSLNHWHRAWPSTYTLPLGNWSWRISILISHSHYRSGSCTYGQSGSNKQADDDKELHFRCLL